VLAKVMNY